MNIYITKANEEYLRGFGKEGESMSGYINRLLENARGATPLQVAKEGFEEALDEWPKAVVTQAIPLPARPVIIKTKKDAERAVEPLYRDKKNKRL